MNYTISDIAKICGVSKATVSRVINNKSEGVGADTKERILETIKELNYRPNVLARSIAGVESKMIGVVVPDITNPYFPQLVRGIDDYLSDLGYTIFLCNSDNDSEKEKRHLYSFVDKRVDGIILATGMDNMEILDIIKQYNIPIVCVDRVLNTSNIDASVSVNNINGAMSATLYLMDKGNQKIAFLGGKKEVVNTIERKKGYEKAFKLRNQPIDEHLMLFGDFTIDSGMEMAKKLMNYTEDIDALFVGGDVIAIGVIKYLKSIGKRIPEDIEIIGFDGIELGQVFDPNLSTVSQPIYEMATQISKMLIHRIEGTLGSMRHIVIEPELVLRETTRP